MDGRPLKECVAHGKAWNVMEGTRRYWKILDLCYHGSCLDVNGWLSYCMPHVSYLASLLFHLPLHILGFTHHLLCYTLLLTLRLLIAYWAWLMMYYCTFTGVLISHSRVAGSSPAWLLVFYCRSTRAYSRALFPSYPVWLVIFPLLSGHSSTSLAPLFN